jgi:hypothetical protein
MNLYDYGVHIYKERERRVRSRAQKYSTIVRS